MRWLDTAILWRGPDVAKAMTGRLTRRRGYQVGSNGPASSRRLEKAPSSRRTRSFAVDALTAWRNVLFFSIDVRLPGIEGYLGADWAAKIS